VITGRCWRRSRGGSAPGRRGGMRRRSSDPGRRCGSGIAAGQVMGPTRRSSIMCWPAKTPRASSAGWSRRTRRSCGRISIRLGHPPPGARGAGSNDKIREPADHAIGRSRGGLTTKVHALADAGIRPVALLLSAGQAGDNPRLAPHIALYGLLSLLLLIFSILAFPPRRPSSTYSAATSRLRGRPTAAARRAG
jgi:putative transposase